MKAITNNVVAISKQRVAADVIAEASQRASRAAREHALERELLLLEREGARHADRATREERAVKRIRTAWTLPLVLLAGLVVWAADRAAYRYEDPTTTVALAVSLALALAAATGWRAAPYPKLAFPMFVIAPLALLASGVVTIAVVVGVWAGVAWFVVCGGLAIVRLRGAWSAFALGRNVLRRQAVEAEVAVMKAALGALRAQKD